MQYLKFQLIKKHTPFHIPPGCLLPPASVQSDSSSHRLCLICFSEIKIERSRNIYLFAGAFCFTSKLPLMASSVDLKNGIVLAPLRIDCYIAHLCGSKQNILQEEGGKKRLIAAAECRQQPRLKLKPRLGIHIKHTHDAAYRWRNGTNQFGFQKCFTYVLMLHDLQSLCKWAAAPRNGFCSSWEAGVSEKLLIEGEM